MPGPARVPTEQLKARGSWRGKQRAKTEPKPRPIKPKMPRSLNADAKAVWRAIMRTTAPGQIAGDSAQVMERYCHTAARWQKLAAWADSNDATYTTGSGVIRVHPNVRLLAALDEQLLRVEAQLGITPAARSKVSAVPEPTKRNEQPELKLRIAN